MIEWFVIIVVIIVFLVNVSIKVTVDLQGSNFAKKIPCSFKDGKSDL